MTCALCLWTVRGEYCFQSYSAHRTVGVRIRIEFNSEREAPSNSSHAKIFYGMYVDRFVFAFGLRANALFTVFTSGVLPCRQYLRYKCLPVFGNLGHVEDTAQLLHSFQISNILTYRYRYVCTNGHTISHEQCKDEVLQYSTSDTNQRGSRS